MAAVTEQRVILDARNLTKTYEMGEVEVPALRDASLQVFESEFLVVLGPSGSGKSTLLNILGGLDTATSGELYFIHEGIGQESGQDLSNADDNALTQFRRAHVGFVFQFYNLVPSLTARENVALVTEIADDPMTPEEALRLVELTERIDHFPSQLSGGEQQRVAIARAIAKRPTILLCDEPTGALDVTTGKIVLQVLDHLNRTLGTTTAVITHNAAIAGMAHRVVRMNSGRIAEISVNEVRQSPDEIEW